MEKPRHLSRRNFAAVLAASTAAAQTGPPNPNTSVQQAQQQRQGTMPEVPPFQAPIEFARNPVPAKVEPFPLTQVRLLAGPYKEAEEANRGPINSIFDKRYSVYWQVSVELPTQIDAKHKQYTE